MRLRVTGLLLIAGMVQISALWAQNVPPSPTAEVSLCDLVKEPAKFDKLKISIRGEVVSEFEDFSIRDKACGEPELPGIWLMFGGDVDCPTPSTWDDVNRPKGKDVEFQGVRYALVKDRKFKEFYRVVTTRKHQRAVYRVNATLEGTFFAGHISTSKDSGGELPGYGHLGCCRLFIIDRVVDVNAARIE
jgi:hypothetical protein